MYIHVYIIYYTYKTPNIVNAANLAMLYPFSHDITCISNLSEV